MTTRTTFRQHGEFPHPTPVLNEALLPLELLSLPLSPVFYGCGVPRGDGSAVVLIPGLAGVDHYLLPMHVWLRRIGYRPYLSQIGTMADCPRKISERLDETIRRAFTETGRRRVHLIGYSLGGIFARSVAVRKSKQIASVISLASPFRGLVAHEIVFTLGKLVRVLIHVRNKGLPTGCGTSRCPCAFGQSLTGQWPASVGQTAIYSTSDGLVDWRHCCTGREGVDIEVQGTHLGMPFNLGVYEQIARRLALSGRTAPRRRGPKLKPSS